MLCCPSNKQLNDSTRVIGFWIGGDLLQKLGIDMLLIDTKGVTCVDKCCWADGYANKKLIAWLVELARMLAYDGEV